MKNLKRILSFFIVMGFMFVMFGFRVGVKADTYNAIYTVTDFNACSGSGDISGLTGAYSQTYTEELYKLTNTHSATLTVSGLDGKKVNSVTLYMKSNSSGGSMSLSVNAGTTNILTVAKAGFQTKTWNGSYSTSYVNLTKTTTTDYTIQSNEDLVITITCGANSVYIQRFTINYEAGSLAPAVLINTPANANLMIQNTLQLTSSVQNVGNIVTDVWESSNTSVATVSNTGLVTPVAMGTTNITRTVNGTVSNVISLKIWPSNSSNISIATALEIAEFVGTGKTPFLYSSSGTVSNVLEKQFALSDGVNTIIAYNKDGHNLSNGDTVVVTGKITTYNSEAEYTESTFGYTIAFNSDGGSPSYDNLTGIASGTKISNPGNPTRSGYTFTGWFNGNTEWNFENDTVTGPLTLTAHWASNAAQTAINNALESTNAYMSLAYGYTLNKVDNPTTYTKATSISHLRAGDSVIIISKFDGNYYALKNNGSSTGPSEAIEITNDIIENIDSSCVWTLEGNSISGWNLKSNSKYIYNPSSTTLNLDSSDKTTFTFVIDGNKTYFKSADRAMFYYEKDATKSFKNYAISNFGGSYYANETYIFVKQATVKYSFRDVDFRIRCAIDDSLAILNEDYAVTLGIEVTAGGQTRKYHNGASFQNGNGKFFVTLDLGDMLNTNYANLDTEFTVRAYVEYQGAYFYSTNSKTYSVKGMVDYYYNNQHIDAVSGLKEILENYGYTFE